MSTKTDEDRQSEAGATCVASPPLNDLLSALADMVGAVEAITYPGWNADDSIYIGRHGDSDCTEEVKPALDRAKKLLGR